MKALTNFLTKTTALALIASSCFVQVNAKEIQSMESEFQFYFNGMEMDTDNKLSISEVDGKYLVDFSLDHWMASAVNRGEFEWQDCQAKPSSRHFLAKSMGISKEEKIDYDYDSGMIAYSEDDDEKEIPITEGIQDSLSFFMQARCDMMAGKKELVYDVLYLGKIRTMRFNVVGQEKVETPYGDFHALRIERDHGKSKRKSIFWVAPELDYLIVKVYHRENMLIDGYALLKKHQHSVKKPQGALAMNE